MDAPTRYGIDVPKWKCRSNHLNEGSAHHEDYGNRHRPGEKCFCATCKSREFLFHRSRYDLMKPVVPSTVPYPDMRSR
jgi:hypothetical protein